jgi:3-hydroxyisobutyrate dehydrogenase
LFAQKNGIDPAHMLTIINESACGNGITKLKTPSILNNDFPAAFALKLLAKDLRLAGEQGISTPLFQPLHDSYQEAVKAGLGEDDCMAIFKYLKVKE